MLSQPWEEDVSGSGDAVTLRGGPPPHTGQSTSDRHGPSSWSGGGNPTGLLGQLKLSLSGTFYILKRWGNICGPINWVPFAQILLFPTVGPVSELHSQNPNDSISKGTDFIRSVLGGCGLEEGWWVLYVVLEALHSLPREPPGAHLEL